MSSATPLVTAEELEKEPRDYRYELVEGQIVRMSPVGFEHGQIVTRLLVLIQQHLQRQPVGVVFTEVGFKLARQPDTVRAPDVAFIRRERIPSPAPKGFFDGPPDLAVEVRSPDERAAGLREKVDAYLSAGVPIVVVVDPDDQRVTCHRSLDKSATLGPADRLDLRDVIPGFTCQVSEILS
jgi:Uma2 family endonuclease